MALSVPTPAEYDTRVKMKRRFQLGIFLLLAVATGAQTLHTPKSVRIGVAAMQNVSTRPYGGRDPRDRLILYLNNKQAKPGVTIIAVPLDATSRAAANAEAAEKQCDYVVYTTLVSLHAVTDAGELRVGIDPVPQPPGPPYKSSPVYVGLMKFELVREGDTLLETNVRSVQRITAEDMIAVLMNQVAERVRKQIGKS